MLFITALFSVVQSLSHVQFCDSVDLNTPGFPVLHHLPVFAQTHVHRVKWCHLTISSSVIPFSPCLQSFSASGSFPMSQFFTSGGQSIGISALALVLPMNIQDWFPLGWTGLISCSPRDSKESSPTPQLKSIHSTLVLYWYRDSIPTSLSTLIQ